MHIQIRAKNLELTPSLSTFVNQKMGKLARMIKKSADVAEMFVDVERQTHHHKKGDVYWVEANIIIPGKKFFAKAHGDDIHDIIVDMREELQQAIKKFKTKVIDMPRRRQRKANKKNM